MSAENYDEKAGEPSNPSPAVLESPPLPVKSHDGEPIHPLPADSESFASAADNFDHNAGEPSDALPTVPESSTIEVSPVSPVFAAADHPPLPYEILSDGEKTPTGVGNAELTSPENRNQGNEAVERTLQSPIVDNPSPVSPLSDSALEFPLPPINQSHPHPENTVTRERRHFMPQLLETMRASRGPRMPNVPTNLPVPVRSPTYSEVSRWSDSTESTDSAEEESETPEISQAPPPRPPRPQEHQLPPVPLTSQGPLRLPPIAEETLSQLDSSSSSAPSSNWSQSPPHSGRAKSRLGTHGDTLSEGSLNLSETAGHLAQISEATDRTAESTQQILQIIKKIDDGIHEDSEDTSDQLAQIVEAANRSAESTEEIQRIIDDMENGLSQNFGGTTDQLAQIIEASNRSAESTERILESIDKMDNGLSENFKVLAKNGELIKETLDVLIEGQRENHNAASEQQTNIHQQWKEIIDLLHDVSPTLAIGYYSNLARWSFYTLLLIAGLLFFNTGIVNTLWNTSLHTSRAVLRVVMVFFYNKLWPAVTGKSTEEYAIATSMWEEYFSKTTAVA